MIFKYIKINLFSGDMYEIRASLQPHNIKHFFELKHSTPITIKFLDNLTLLDQSQML